MSGAYREPARPLREDEVKPKPEKPKRDWGDLILQGIMGMLLVGVAVVVVCAIYAFATDTTDQDRRTQPCEFFKNYKQADVPIRCLPNYTP